MMIKNNKNLLPLALLSASIVLSACSSRAPDDTNSDQVLGAVSAIDFGDDGNNGFAVVGTASVYAYRKNSPYASVLKDCVLINTVADSCQVSKLPFIGNGTTQPTIEDVMNRVLVTHNWMGERFEEVLRGVPEEVMTMFSSATAVLIGSEVRPSFYTTLTGAIQIDPVYLWSSVAEKGSISKEEDFRAGFGNDLQFWFISRMADKNGDRLSPYYSLDDNSVRPIKDIKLPLTRLLVHELVHATDFMPRSLISGIDPNLSVFEAIESISSQWLSPLLYTSHPLTSLEMQSFAGVRYLGAEASTQHKAATASDVGNLMANDGAPQFYSYATIREDLAQLVESVVMGYRYGAVSNVGFTQKPFDENNYTCDDLRVSWGQRNRIADPLVNPRARQATELVLSLSAPMALYLDAQQGNAEQMQKNVGWCDNQQSSTVATAEIQSRSGDRMFTPESGPLFREMMEADRTVHPAGLQLP